MKIKHAVILSDDEIDHLWQIYPETVNKVYSTAEEQILALSEAKIKFETYLNRLIQQSFKYGKKIGKAKADEKDTTMYKPEM